MGEPMRTTLSHLVCLACLVLVQWAGGRFAHAGDDSPGTRLRSLTSGRAAGLSPISRGRAAALSPVTRDRAAKLAPITRGRAASLPGVSAGKSALLPGVSVNRPARLAPVTRNRAANVAPVTTGRAAALEPVTRERAAGLAPVTRERAADLPAVSADRAARMAAVTRGRGARLAPVTRGRAAGLLPRSGERELDLLKSLLEPDLPPILSFPDGYVAPLRARVLVKSGRLGEALGRVEDGAAAPGAELYDHRVGAVRVRDGRGADVLDRIGFHPDRGKRAAKDPLAYYVRSGRIGGGAAPVLLLVPPGHAEEVPEAYDRTLRGSPDPIAIAMKALGDGHYIQAALAFGEVRYRSPGNLDAAFGLADAQLALGNLEAAAESVRAGLDCLSHWADDLDARRVATGEGEITKRIEAVARCVERRPTSESGLFLLGYLRLASGLPDQVAKAHAPLRTALDLDPNGRHTLRLIRHLQSR